MRMDANTQRKRLRRNGAAQASDDSKSSDDEVQQICDVQNSSEAETEDESEVAEKTPSARPAHMNMGISDDHAVVLNYYKRTVIA